jgi:hypothetical protein
MLPQNKRKRGLLVIKLVELHLKLVGLRKEMEKTFITKMGTPRTTERKIYQ